MKTKPLIRVAGIGGALLAATAFAGLPWADASPSARVADASSTHLNCVHLDVDDQAVCGIMRTGPRGPRGHTGDRGLRGHTGRTGPIGLTGARGITGAVGAIGAQGIQGPQGLQGVQGAPGHTVVVAGTQVVETAPGAGDQNKTLSPSVAQCPAASSGTPEAYGGGVQIQTTGQETSGDVVSIAQHMLGTVTGGTFSVPANGSAATAYEGQAVITTLAAGDTATVQAYVVCGP